MSISRKYLYSALLTLALLCLLVSACGGQASPQSEANEPMPQNIPNPPTPGGGRMIFSAAMGEGGNFEIYRINADGTDQVNLTNNPARDMLPALSPDQGKVAFTSDRDGKTQIYVMNADGTEVRQLTRDDAEKGILRYTSTLSWSPDGKWIAYTALVGEKADIFTIKSAGGDPVNLTGNPADDLLPAWSPDGKKIAFHSDRDGTPQIYLMDANGSNVQRLSGGSGVDVPAGWSPDAKQLLFYSNRDGNWEVYIMKADGTEQVNLSNNSASDNSPAFSPDGRQIAFRSNRDGRWQLTVMNRDGSDQRNISNGEGDDNWLTWSPDGTQIYVSSTRGDDPQNLEWSARIINVDGSGQEPFLVGGNINWMP